MEEEEELGVYGDRGEFGGGGGGGGGGFHGGISVEAIKDAVAAGRGTTAAGLDARRRWGVAGSAAAFMGGPGGGGDGDGADAVPPEPDAVPADEPTGKDARRRWAMAGAAAAMVGGPSQGAVLPDDNGHDDERRDADGMSDVSFHSFGDIIERRKRAWQHKLHAHQAAALAGGSLATNAFKYDRGPRAVGLYKLESI
jgi:hypothetical protein